MSSNDTDVIEGLHAVATGIDMPAAPVAEDLQRGRRRLRRNRLLVAGAATAAVVVVIGVTATVAGQKRAAPVPAEPPGIVVGDVPVWYDAKGLHRGDVVEQTPVKLMKPERVVAPGQVQDMEGALALVRTGALYLDPATFDVWFHPWGGDPRVVGHHSAWGPGGDPDGDTAAWFEGDELVIYDTAAGRTVSRTSEPGTGGWLSGDHNPAGNTFLQVSAERVAWAGQRETYSHDLRTKTTSVIEAPTPNQVLDVHDQVVVLGELQGTDATVTLSVPGRAEQRLPGLEPRARLNASGNYLLAVAGTETLHAAVIVNTRTGQRWVPKNAYPWIAWSYGNIALIDTEDALLACDAARRVCESVPVERPFLMPTN
jgi:hypothetical protein